MKLSPATEKRIRDDADRYESESYVEIPGAGAMAYSIGATAEAKWTETFANLVEEVLNCGFRQPEISDDWYERAPELLKAYREASPASTKGKDV